MSRYHDMLNFDQSVQPDAALPERVLQFQRPIEITHKLPLQSVLMLVRQIETLVPADGGRIIHFAGVGGRVGTSTVALETGLVASRILGRSVLFLESGRGTLPALDLVRQEVRQGLQDVIDGVADIREAMISLEEGGFTYAHAHGLGYGSHRRQLRSVGLMQELRKNFDLVVVDGGPLSGDIENWPRLSDGSVLVVRSGVTRLSALAEASAQVEALGGRKVGVVLNRHRFAAMPGWLRRAVARQALSATAVQALPAPMPRALLR